jgi:UDP-N-acetylglucosamine--N-acetylmuramyl-(pentapeptide) pyrophosphoryl-undecaprenol N-acetylglucosamine transferase
LAVAETLLARRHEVKLLVSQKAVDQSALTRHPSLSVQTISAVGYRGAGHMVSFCRHLLNAVGSCGQVCAEFAPNAVLGMGGFTSAPAVFAARRRGTTTLIHESNAVPGKANRWAGKLADHVAVGLADCARFFGRRSVTVTGTPIRAGLRRGKAADAHARLGLNRDWLTVAVAGGSQGAHALNESIAAALPWLADWKETTQFVHLSGLSDEQVVRSAYERNGFAANVMSFCGEMELVYSAADLVVSRSGAGTLTELAAFGLPAILVPFPHAAGNHQWHNARVFAKAGAAWIVEQSKAREELPAAIAGLLADGAARIRMANAARSLAVADAAERIADLVETHAD